MKTVRQLKEDLQVNGDLSGLMDVLKGISVSEFRALSRRLGRFSIFTEAFEGFFQTIDFSQTQHPFTREQGSLGVIMVTSNEGFMGGLNERVISEALGYPEARQAELIIVGEQGAAVLESMGHQFVRFPGVASGECYEAAVAMRDYVMAESRGGRFGRLILFYPRPVSAVAQKIERVRILPCTKLFEGKLEDTKEGQEIIVESPLDEIVEYLVEMWITQKLFEVYEDSKLAEFSARTVRLEESSQALLEQRKEIQYRYFREYHELVDAGMRDIYSAQIVRKKQRKQIVEKRKR